MSYFAKLTFATLCLTTAAFAGEPLATEPLQVSYSESVGSAERIESGDFLRVYSQEVAAAACFYHNGIDMELSQELLLEARYGFGKHLDALRTGNEELGIIGKEERRKTIARLDAVEAVWTEIDQAVGALLEDFNDKAAVGVIKDKNLPLFELTDLLLSDLEGEYANPAELIQADVLMLEIAGRQAMMTQKIAKNACKLLSGRDTEKVREDLIDSVSLYELSLNALLNGMPQVGLKPAPTEEIAERLRLVQQDWAETRPVVDAILSGAQDTDALEYLFQHMAEEMHKLEEITHMYVVFSKHEY